MLSKSRFHTYFDSILHTSDSVDTAFADRIRSNADILLQLIAVSEMNVVAMKLLQYKINMHEYTDYLFDIMSGK